MASSSYDDEFIALDSLVTKTIRKKVGVHSINRERGYIMYTRMNHETFEYILEKVKHILTKNWCTLQSQPILPEERLVITLRKHKGSCRRLIFQNAVIFIQRWSFHCGKNCNRNSCCIMKSIATNPHACSHERRFSKYI